MLSEGLITLGHARALLGLLDDRRMLEFANEVVANQLSVREVERRVREANEPSRSAESQQSVRPSRGFYSSEDLERLLELILGDKRSDFDDAARTLPTRSDLADLDEIIFP